MNAIPPPEAAAARPILWQAYASEGAFGLPKHQRWLDAKLVGVAETPDACLAVSWPPGHGKTTFIGHAFSTWWLGRHPTHKVVYISMQERFSRKQGRAARDYFSSRGEEVFGATCHRRASTAEWLVLKDGMPTGGSMVSVGAGGTITGERADLVVIDDMIRDNKEALNVRLMDEMWDWYRTVVVTRGKPGCRFVILMTRWSHMDLIAHLKRDAEESARAGKPVRWEFVNLPALAEQDDPMGRLPGDALWPEMWPVGLLENKRDTVGPYTWESLFQGRPTPKSGGIFKLDWLRDYEKTGVAGVVSDSDVFTLGALGTLTARELLRFGVADLAASTKRRADYTVLTAWGWCPRLRVLLLLGLERARFEGPEYVPAFRRLVESFALPVVYCEREGPMITTRLGFSVVKEAVQSGLPVVEITPDADKVSRAHASTGAWASGQVWLPEARKTEWRPAFDTELLTFPAGEHDDQVDVCTYAVGLFRQAMHDHRGQPRQEPEDEGGGWWNGAR